MLTQYVEPLEPNAWFDALENIKLELAACEKDDCAHLLRRAFHIFRLSPAPMRPIFNVRVSEVLFERLLHESEGLAAMSLLENVTELQLSANSMNEGYVVKLRIGDSIGRSLPEGEPLQIACLRALLSAVIDLVEC